MLASLLPAPINADTIPFTHSTAPLGISLAQFKRQYPECGAEAKEGRSEEATFLEPEFEPLTGYDPPFPDLLPNYRGSYLTSVFPWAGAVLGDGYFAVYFIHCPDGNNQFQPYTVLIYQGKIAVVNKSARGQGPADRLMARLQQRLSGRQGPLHKARAVLAPADVFVKYADQGNIRTVVETRPAVGWGYYHEAGVQVAYVDLTLWRDYSSRVEAKLKAMSEREEREAQTLMHSNVPLGISLAQFEQQYPHCRAREVEVNPWGFPPLTRYVPPFLDLLPNYQGSHLTSSRPQQPGKPMPTLGDGYFGLYNIDCGDGTNQSQYMALIYQGKIAVVQKAAWEAGEGPVDRVIARLQQSLSGRQGPLHKAGTAPGAQPADVLVTYADLGNIRTVVEAEAGPRPDEVTVAVAHVDLTLWRDYSSRVEADLEAKSEREEREAPTLTHSNVPLGISLAQFQQQYPQCRATKNLSPGYTIGFEPLTGYYPPFPDLLPNYQGSYLTISAPVQPSQPVPTLGDGYFALYAIHCGDGTNQSQYTALMYQGKIAVVRESLKEAGQPLDRVIARLQLRLSGRQGPLHKATSARSQEFGRQVLDVLVTYADEDSIRTVVDAQEVPGVDEVILQIAHVDLTLWRDYSGRVEAKLKAVSEREEQEAQTLTHSDISLGISLAQFKQQYPQCRATQGPGENDDFGPLVGYDPPFLDLLPNYQGKYPSLGRWGGERPAILEFGDFYRIDCGGGTNQSQYTAVIYQGKIAVVRKSAEEAGQGPPDRVIARFQQRLPGRQGPLHKATSWHQFHHDVLVTYADDGNIRTVVEAEAVPGVDEVLVQVAHVDLTLWRDYSSTVEAEAKATSESEEQETRKIEQEL